MFHNSLKKTNTRRNRRLKKIASSEEKLMEERNKINQTARIQTTGPQSAQMFQMFRV